jgi:hypothetical protein
LKLSKRFWSLPLLLPMPVWLRLPFGLRLWLIDRYMDACHGPAWRRVPLYRAIRLRIVG